MRLAFILLFLTCLTHAQSLHQPSYLASTTLQQRQSRPVVPSPLPSTNLIILTKRGGWTRIFKIILRVIERYTPKSIFERMGGNFLKKSLDAIDGFLDMALRKVGLGVFVDAENMIETRMVSGILKEVGRGGDIAEVEELLGMNAERVAARSLTNEERIAQSSQRLKTLDRNLERPNSELSKTALRLKEFRTAQKVAAETKRLAKVEKEIARAKKDAVELKAMNDEVATVQKAESNMGTLARLRRIRPTKLDALDASSQIGSSKSHPLGVLGMAGTAILGAGTVAVVMGAIGLGGGEADSQPEIKTSSVEPEPSAPIDEPVTPITPPVPVPVVVQTPIDPDVILPFGIMINTAIFE